MLQLSIHLFDGRMAMGLLSDYLSFILQLILFQQLNLIKPETILLLVTAGAGQFSLSGQIRRMCVLSILSCFFFFFLDVNFVILPYCLLFLTTIKYFIYHNISMEDPEGIWRGWTIQQVGILSFVIRQSFRAMNLRYSRWMSNFYMYFRSACWIWNSCTHTLSECHISV